MPLIYRCAECGEILYVYSHSNREDPWHYMGPPTIEEVVWRIRVCPNCGRRLITIPPGKAKPKRIKIENSTLDL